MPKYSNSQHDDNMLNLLIKLCEDLSWGRAANEEELYALTMQGAGPEQLTRLAEAFGFMLVQLDARNMHKEKLISDLELRNQELETIRQQLTFCNSVMTQTIQETYASNLLIGQCEAIRQVSELTLSIARRPINTLILGPTGSGKEVVAKMLHFNSARKDKAFVAVNCTAIPDSLFESEMFGIEKGIATGVGQRIGLIEAANGGTLFLDELAELSLVNQAKLLRVLEEKEVLRVGKSKPTPVDVNVISATNADLYQEVQNKRFREDLYYRLNVAEIRLPALAVRGDDILILAKVFLDSHCARLRSSPLSISVTAQAMLLNYPWPGNVRELNNEMERAAALTVGSQIEGYDLSIKIQQSQSASLTINSSLDHSDVAHSDPQNIAKQQNNETEFLEASTLEQIESAAIFQALKNNNGNKSHTAKELGLSREGLRKKMLRLDIKA